jgi:putative peptidoglycan lipid II flippase
MSDVKKVAKYSVIITAILVLSKLSGLIYEFILAAVFGATRESDILRISIRMPNVLFAAVSAALVTAFIPTFANVKNDKEKANQFFNNVLNIIFIICAAIAVVGIIIAPQLTKAFAGGFKGEDFNRTVYMTRIVMPSIVFLGISGLYTGYLQSYGVFIQPALTGITANAVIIIGVLMFHKYGIIAGIISVFFSSIAQVAIQRPFMKGYKYRPFINLKDENVRKMLILAVPTIISTTFSQINPMVSGNFASRLAEGSISVFDYANKFSTIINQVFIISITTVLYPGLTEKFANNDMEEFRRSIARSINIVVIVAVPLIFGLMALSTPLIKLLLEHGRFDWRATEMTSLCLKYLAFGALGYSLVDILSKIFYAAKNTWIPMTNGFINVTINVILTSILAPRVGVSGLAIANMFAICIVAVWMFIQVNLKIKDIKYVHIIKTLGKTLAAGVGMALVVSLSFNLLSRFLSGSNILLAVNLAVATVVGAVTYLALMSLLKVDELKTVIDMTLGKFLKKKISV